MPYRRVTDPEKLEALLSASLIVGSDLDLDAILHRIIEQAAILARARYGALGVLDDTGDSLARFVTVGLTDLQITRIGAFPTGKGVLGLLIREPAPIRLADISAHTASVGFPAGHPPMKSFLGVPVRIRDVVYGNLYLTDKQGEDEFNSEDEELVSQLAAAAGIAIENARLHEKVQQLAMADDRERIARDLHDTVIQRLFAIGLSLQSVVPQVHDDGAARRIEESVVNLDETIRQVRTAIFSLEAAPETRTGLRARVLAATAAATKALGFEPQVRFAGAIDSQVGDDVADVLLASLQELLSNVAHHARATRCAIEVSLEQGHLNVEVVDDGVGLPPGGPATKGTGIPGIVRLTTSMGGSCVVRNAPSGGTAITWRVPV